MELDGIILDSIEVRKRGKIIILEEPRLDAQAYQKDLAVAREMAQTTFTHPVEVLCFSQGLQDPNFFRQSVFDDALIFFGANWGRTTKTEGTSYIGLMQLAKTARMIEDVLAAGHNSDYAILARPGMDSTSFRAVARHVIQTIGGGRVFPDTIQWSDLYGTDGVMWLKNNLHKDRHGIIARQDDRIMNMISNAYAGGNSQSKAQKKFVLISGDQILDNDGKFSSVTFKDLPRINNWSDTAAILVDNWYKPKKHKGRLGDGIKALHHLTKSGVTIPIFYRSGHKREDFSADELRSIERAPNIFLIPKYSVPKIVDSKIKAEKEIRVSQIASQSPALAPYICKPILIGENGYVQNEKSFIAFHSIAPTRIPTDKIRDTLFKKLNIQKNTMNIRMYVLANFHQVFYESTDPIITASSVPHFLAFDTIRERVNNIDHIQDAYNTSLDASFREGQISHNDAKDDNWFGGYILGDYANVGPGSVSRDIARSLLDERERFAIAGDRDAILKYIKTYYDIQTELGTMICGPNLVHNVFKSLLVESLRIAYFKSQWNDPNLALAYTKLAELYSTCLTAMTPTMETIKL